MAGGTVALGIILCRGRRNRNNQPQNQNLLIENVQNDSHNRIMANKLSNENRNNEMDQNQAENARESENNLISIAELSNGNNLTTNNIILGAGKNLVSVLQKLVLKKHFRDLKLRIEEKSTRDAKKKFGMALRKIMLKEYFRSFNLRV